MKKINTNSLPTVTEINTELKNERNKIRFRRIIKSSLYTLVLVAAIAVLIATLVLPVLQISGTSMEPTLNNGEIVVLLKTNKLERGELCGFSYSNKILIKRVVGLPGDYVTVDEEGFVYINGELLEEPYISDRGLGECDIEFPYQVPENEYFLMGDHRTTSIDSRSSVIGCVPYDQIVGKIFLKVWPLDRITIID
ncbi:MAG: signal peptidase I [Clostridia bacterium]|nr:signal peptidase I [Clostridia bacterium]